MSSKSKKEELALLLDVGERLIALHQPYSGEVLAVERCFKLLELVLRVIFTAKKSTGMAGDAGFVIGFGTLDRKPQRGFRGSLEAGLSDPSLIPWRSTPAFGLQLTA